MAVSFRAQNLFFRDGGQCWHVRGLTKQLNLMGLHATVSILWTEGSVAEAALSHGMPLHSLLRNHASQKCFPLHTICDSFQILLLWWFALVFFPASLFSYSVHRLIPGPSVS
jgi:hypothetical protein